MEHRSRNSMCWRGLDAKVTAARKAKGWVEFHRRCGEAGLYFDDIDPAPGGGYGAVTFTLDRADRFRMIHVSEGRGKDPIAACRAAFRAAVAAGHAVDASLETLFDATPAAFDPVAALVG